MSSSDLTVLSMGWDACKYEVQVEKQLLFCLMKLEDGEGYT
jgi:hypothetical protein